VAYLIEAREFSEAARITEEIVPRAILEGRSRTVLRLIDPLPKRIFALHPRLLLARSAVAIDSGKFLEAQILAQSALRRCARRGDSQGTVRALVLQANIERFRGNFGRGIRLGQQAIKLCRETLRDRSLEAQALRTLGILHGMKGDLRQSLVMLRRALELYQKEGDEVNRAYVSTSLGTALRREGRLVEADAYYYQALEIWRHLGNTVEEARLLNNLAVGKYSEGDHRGALELFEESLAKAFAASAPGVECNILAGMADVYRELGQLGRAKGKYKETLQLARKVGDASLVLYATDGLAETHRREGDLAGARSYLRRALEMVEKSPSWLDRARVYITAGLLSSDLGLLKESRTRLVQAKRITELAGAKGELARVLFGLAVYEFKSRQKAKAKDYLGEGLELARSQRIEFFLLNPQAKPLLQLAIDQGIMPDYVTELLQRIEALYTLSSMIEERAEPIPKADRLEVRALGGSRVWINGKEVPLKAWRGRKEREIFFLLVEGKPKTRDEIGVVLWPELSSQRMSSVFHAALYRIRKVLRGEWIVFDPTREVYGFNRQGDYWYDVETFERNLAAARKRKGDPEAALPEYLAAIGLYGGEFLPELDSEWVELRRQDLEKAFVEALSEVAEMLIRLNRPSMAVDHLLRAGEIEPYREDLLRKAMVALALAGQAGKALERFDHSILLLRDELGIGPAVETVNLAQEIRERQPSAERLLSYFG
ncbi:MAG: tetratricopeptide repeat protein, partial [Chloroflexi bacterium]|nr:tetratricopeptide repeat protein [Chloroflexota bacterium]